MVFYSAMLDLSVDLSASSNIISNIAVFYFAEKFMKLYKVSELADMFHMSKKTIREIIRSKDVKFIRV